MEEASNTIIRNISVAVPNLREIHIYRNIRVYMNIYIYRNDEVVLRRHLDLAKLKNLKAVPSLERLVFDHLP